MFDASGIVLCCLLSQRLHLRRRTCRATPSGLRVTKYVGLASLATVHSNSATSRGTTDRICSCAWFCTHAHTPCRAHYYSTASHGAISVYVTCPMQFRFPAEKGMSIWAHHAPCWSQSSAKPTHMPTTQRSNCGTCYLLQLLELWCILPPAVRNKVVRPLDPRLPEEGEERERNVAALAQCVLSVR